MLFNKLLCKVALNEFMLEQIRYNIKITWFLRRLAKQRVGIVLQPGNVWVIEYAVKENEETLPLIHTCQMRGWVEMLHEPIPMGDLNEDGSFNHDMPFHTKSPIWRLTDTGWAVIQRRHFYTVLGVIAAITGAVETIA